MFLLQYLIQLHSTTGRLSHPACSLLTSESVSYGHRNWYSVSTWTIRYMDIDLPGCLGSLSHISEAECRQVFVVVSTSTTPNASSRTIPHTVPAHTHQTSTMSPCLEQHEVKKFCPSWTLAGMYIDSSILKGHRARRDVLVDSSRSEIAI